MRVLWYSGEVKGNEARHAVARTKRSPWNARGCSSPVAHQYAGHNTEYLALGRVCVCVLPFLYFVNG